MDTLVVVENVLKVKVRSHMFDSPQGRLIPEERMLKIYADPRTRDSGYPDDIILELDDLFTRELFTNFLLRMQFVLGKRFARGKAYHRIADTAEMLPVAEATLFHLRIQERGKIRAGYFRREDLEAALELIEQNK